MKHAKGKALNRGCFVRESDRKSDLSRLSIRVFGPLLPFVTCSRAQDNITLQKEEPHGFEDLCWWVALFGDRSSVE